jgi:hypothetical protein
MWATMTGNGTHWYEPVADRERLDFTELINADTPTVVVLDPQLEQRDQHARAQLRSIPLFQTYGFETVLHTDVWDNQFKLVDYDPLLTDEVDDVFDLSFPLVHVVTQQGITKYGEESIVRQLLQRSLDEGGRYVLVTDTAAPKTPAYTKKPGKSIVDEFADIRVEDYSHLSSVVLESELDSHIPVVDTRNLFFHAASTLHHQRGAPAASIDDIFDFTQAPSESPVWESPRYFIKHDLENVLEDYSERIREALRSWMERGDTQRVANHILETLQVCDYDLEKLEEYRQRSPEHR